MHACAKKRYQDCHSSEKITRRGESYHASARRLIITLRLTMVSRKETIMVSRRVIIKRFALACMRSMPLDDHGNYNQALCACMIVSFRETLIVILWMTMVSRRLTIKRFALACLLLFLRRRETKQKKKADSMRRRLPSKEPVRGAALLRILLLSLRSNSFC